MIDVFLVIRTAVEEGPAPTTRIGPQKYASRFFVESRSAQSFSRNFQSLTFFWRQSKRLAAKVNQKRGFVSISKGNRLQQEKGFNPKPYKPKRIGRLV